ncbi:MAG: hypothetical protein VKL59_23670 [Nostocaceae cyanobacterium]|nr:hypothetical protein [Nostocaceae cyanobacterium]
MTQRRKHTERIAPCHKQSSFTIDVANIMPVTLGQVHRVVDATLTNHQMHCLTLVDYVFD